MKLKKSEEKWKYVNKKDFIDFIQNYPYPLEKDFFMDWYSWNDFEDGKVWPESMVAMCQDDDYHGHIFKIRKDIYERNKRLDRL